MAQQSNATIGSGTLPFTTQILTPEQRGQQANGRGERYGTNVVVVNPEDQIAVDAWAASGVLVPSAAAVQVIGPGITALPRTRKVVLQNGGANAIYIAPTEAGATATDGFSIAGNALFTLELPLLHNNSIWALADTAPTLLKVLVY